MESWNFSVTVWPNCLLGKKAFRPVQLDLWFYQAMKQEMKESRNSSVDWNETLGSFELIKLC